MNNNITLGSITQKYNKLYKQYHNGLTKSEVGTSNDESVNFLETLSNVVDTRIKRTFNAINDTYSKCVPKKQEIKIQKIKFDTNDCYTRRMSSKLNINELSLNYLLEISDKKNIKYELCFKVLSRKINIDMLLNDKNLPKKYVNIKSSLKGKYHSITLNNDEMSKYDNKIYIKLEAYKSEFILNNIKENELLIQIELHDTSQNYNVKPYRIINEELQQKLNHLRIDYKKTHKPRPTIKLNKHINKKFVVKKIKTKTKKFKIPKYKKHALKLDLSAINNNDYNDYPSTNDNNILISDEMRIKSERRCYNKLKTLDTCNTIIALKSEKNRKTKYKSKKKFKYLTPKEKLKIYNLNKAYSYRKHPSNLYNSIFAIKNDIYKNKDVNIIDPDKPVIKMDKHGNMDLKQLIRIEWMSLIVSRCAKRL